MTATLPVWLNGRTRSGEDALIAATDRGFTLGDGVFETMRLRAGRIPWWTDHLGRLRQGAQLLGIALPQEEAAIAAGLAELVAAAGMTEGVLRLTLSRGPAARGLWPESGPPAPTLLATIAAPPPPRRSLRVVLARRTHRNEHSPLSHIKSLNYGDNILARKEAAESGADDALMLNTAGRLACATTANLFLKIAGGWVTPPTSEGVLPGLARARLLARLPAREMPLDEKLLAEAEAGFLSNSLGLSSIAEIEGHPLGEVDRLLEGLRLFG